MYTPARVRGVYTKVWIKPLLKTQNLNPLWMAMFQIFFYFLRKMSRFTMQSVQEGENWGIALFVYSNINWGQEKLSEVYSVPCWTTRLRIQNLLLMQNLLLECLQYNTLHNGLRKIKQSSVLCTEYTELRFS